MCTYCIERNFVLPLWQTGRFVPEADIEAQFDHSYSIECPQFCTLFALQQQGQPLDGVVVLIRLACAALRRPLNADEQQLKLAMLRQQQQHGQVGQSQWPWLDSALTEVFNSGKLPYKDHFTFPTEFTQQLLAALIWAAEHFYPQQNEDNSNNDDAPWDETEHQRLLALNEQLTREFNTIFSQCYLAILLLQQVQPKHPALQQIALNNNACCTRVSAYDLALRRHLQCHCVKHYGMDWFWQHLNHFTMEHIYYMAARLRFGPGEIMALQNKLDDEYAGIDFYMSRKECVAALTELSLAVEFGFDPDENND